jgi:hypothetical protein
MRPAELIEHLTSTEADRGSVADAALEQLIAQAADGADLEPGAAAAVLDRAGCTAEEFARAVEHETQRRAWKAESATLPALEEKLAAVRAELTAANEAHHLAMQAAHAAYSKAAVPLVAERDRLTAAITAAEEARANLEAEDENAELDSILDLEDENASTETT